MGAIEAPTTSNVGGRAPSGVLVSPVMADSNSELLNLYDQAGQVVGQAPRAAAQASGRAVGAVNALIVDAMGRVLLQRRPAGKENGGLWDKSVGGHVSAGEDFDQTMVREAGEELFDDPAAPAVRLAPDLGTFARLRREVNLRRVVLLRRQALQLNLRDVRRVPGAGGEAPCDAPDVRFRNVTYHVAVYLGCTALSLPDFRPQASEIAGLDYLAPAEVDRLLLRGDLAPNMAFLWLSQAHALLAL